MRLARQNSDTGPDIWVADDSNPETSYSALLTISRIANSGWLTWEPHESADIVRSDAVIRFSPHRPAGTDQPWAELATTSGVGVIMHVPLSATVSYSPDPAIYERWSSRWASLEP